MSQSVEERLGVIEKTMLLHSGQIDLLSGFIVSKLKYEDFISYIMFASGSDKFSEPAKLAAHEILRQTDLWPPVLSASLKQ